MTTPTKNTHGGKRDGAGGKKIHAPEHAERIKKYRATDAEWERFLELTPRNSRQAFELILELLENNATE